MSSRYFKYALMDYLPKRFLGHASFEAQENSRHILDFKAGRKYAVDKASKLVGNALSLMDLKDTIIVCIPAEIMTIKETIKSLIASLSAY